MTTIPPQVGILMGSDNDYDIMIESGRALHGFGIPFEMTVASAHRSPQRTSSYVRSARQRGIKVLIAGAGAAAHLAGVVAAETILPVIAVPIDASALQGLDALLAGILAAQIIALGDPAIAQRLEDFKVELASGVEKRAHALEARLQREKF